MDLALSDMSGTALLARLAEARDCGIIVISSMDDEADRIVSLAVCRIGGTRRGYA